MAAETPGKDPKVCAVVLNIGGMAVAEECLRSLAKVEYPGFEVIFVFNGFPQEGLEEAVRAACPKISGVTFTGANRGFAGGNNAGIMTAMSRGADYILLLNDDAFVEPGFLEPLVKELEADPEAGIAGPRICYASEPEKIWFSGATLDRGDCSFEFRGADQASPAYGHEKPEGSDYITGCAALVSRKVIESVGMLDDGFFLYWEDSDWGLRAAEAGFMSVVVPASRVWHKVSLSSGGNDSPMKIFHKARGQLRFARRHCPGGFGRVLRRLLRDFAWLIFKSGRRGDLKRAMAVLAALGSYLLMGKDPGPAWLKERKNT